MVASHIGRCREIGDRSCDPANAIECTNTETEFLDRLDQMFQILVPHAGRAIEIRALQARVRTVSTLPPESTSGENPGSSTSRRLPSRIPVITEQSAQRRRLHGHMKVESIQHRSPDPLEAPPLPATSPIQGTTRIERGDHQGVRGKTTGAAHPGYGDHSILERLSKRIDGDAGELGELVE